MSTEACWISRPQRVRSWGEHLSAFQRHCGHGLDAERQRRRLDDVEQRHPSVHRYTIINANDGSIIAINGQDHIFGYSVVGGASTPTTLNIDGTVTLPTRDLFAPQTQRFPRLRTSLTGTGVLNLLPNTNAGGTPRLVIERGVGSTFSGTFRLNERVAGSQSAEQCERRCRQGHRGRRHRVCRFRQHAGCARLGPDGGQREGLPTTDHNLYDASRCSEYDLSWSRHGRHGNWPPL